MLIHFFFVYTVMNKGFGFKTIECSGLLIKLIVTTVFQPAVHWTSWTSVEVALVLNRFLHFLYWRVNHWTLECVLVLVNHPTGLNV